MSFRSAAGGCGKNVVLKTSAFWLFDAAVPLSVAMYVDVSVVSIYLLTFHIVSSSTSFTNVLHVSCFAFLIIALYSFSASFHSSASSAVLRYLFLILFTSLLASVSSSFHHLLLKGHVFLRGVGHSIALLMAVVMPCASWSIVVGEGVGRVVLSIVGRCSLILAFTRFQSVFSKLNIGVCTVVSCFRFSIVIIGR